MSSLILLAIIGKAQGIKGEVRLQIFAESPANLPAYNPLVTENAETITILSLKPHGKTGWVARLDGVRDRTQAEKLNGTRLYVPRERLPEPDDEDYYITDLIGMDVYDEAGDRLGIVKAVDNFGAGDLLDIAFETTGKTDYLPFTRACVPEIDIAHRRLLVRLPQEAG
jgi:16S rRNA processing protein RimM